MTSHRVLSALLAALLGSALPAVGQDPREARALQAVADYVDRGNEAARLLDGVGFSPPQALRAEWGRLPPQRQLELAFRMAEAARRGEGEELLTKLAYRLQELYAPVRSSDALAPFLARPEPPRVTFAPLAGGQPRAALPARCERAIEAVARYAGGPVACMRVLREHLQLPDEVAYDILAKCDTTADAIKRAQTWVPEAELRPRMDRVVAYLERTYEGARTDANLDAYRDPGLVQLRADLAATTRRLNETILELATEVNVTRAEELRAERDALESSLAQLTARREEYVNEDAPVERASRTGVRTPKPPGQVAHRPDCESHRAARPRSVPRRPTITAMPGGPVRGRGVLLARATLLAMPPGESRSPRPGGHCPGVLRGG